MALAYNDNHIIYYHMDAQQSVGLGRTYFTSPDYLVVQCLVCYTFFHPDTMNPRGSHVYHCTKFSQGGVGYNSLGVPFAQLVAVINYFSAALPFVFTAFPTFKI